jgi:hypothetical protein
MSAYLHEVRSPPRRKSVFIVNKAIYKLLHNGMEYINAADGDSNNVFVDIWDSIHSLHFIFIHIFNETVTREAKGHHRRIKCIYKNYSGVHSTIVVLLRVRVMGGVFHRSPYKTSLLNEMIKHERAISYVIIHVVASKDDGNNATTSWSMFMD